MARTAPARTTVEARPRPEVRDVADMFTVLMRSAGKARARMLAAAAHDVEWSAHLLLKVVAQGGPIRAGALAECLHSDPSTVSRQVAALVKDGLLERRADPEDGRASLLVTTEKAAEVLARHEEVRLQHFAKMLAGWSERDLHRFAALLRRFTHDFESANHSAFADQAAARPHQPEGSA